MSTAPFCYPPEGAVVVCGDGPEVFVYGQNDAPLWKQFCEGILVGVGATRDRVFTLDTDGRLTSWRSFDGSKLDEAMLDARGCRGLVNAPDGTCAVLAQDAVVVADPRGSSVPIAAPGASAVAFGANRGSLAVGTTGGKLLMFDTASGRSLGSVDVGGPVAGVAWRSQGQWVVAAGTKLVLVQADGKGAPTSIECGAPTSHVAVTADGALAAVVAGGQNVTVVEFAGNTILGHVRYTRQINGLGFGDGTWLGIGLDDAEANRVDLITGKMARTETFQGRTANRWGFKVEVDQTRTRQVVSQVRAGGKAIAVQMFPGEEGGSNGCLYGCLVTFVLFLICSGCTGIFTGFYYFVYLP